MTSALWLLNNEPFVWGEERKEEHVLFNDTLNTFYIVSGEEINYVGVVRGWGRTSRASHEGVELMSLDESIWSSILSGNYRCRAK